MTNLELRDKLIEIVNLPTYYKNKYPENCGFNKNGKYGFDCVCLLKCAMSGWTPTDEGKFMPPSKFICGDISEKQMIDSCGRSGTDFSKIPAYGTALYLPGHIGCYVGEYTLLDGRVVNCIECTTSYGANCVTWSWFDLDGTRRPYKGGAPSSKKWTKWGVLDKWVQYVSINPEEEPKKAVKSIVVPAPVLAYGSRGTKARNLQRCLNECGYNLAEDGLFFNKSTDALKDWQRKNCLEVDGIFGSKSYAKMIELLQG